MEKLKSAEGFMIQNVLTSLVVTRLETETRTEQKDQISLNALYKTDSSLGGRAPQHRYKSLSLLTCIALVHT